MSVEAKWSETPEDRWLGRINDVAQILSKSKTQRRGQAYLVCRTGHPFSRENIRCLHAVEYFRRLGA